MWLIALMIVLLLLPMALAALVYLLAALVRFIDALVPATISAVRRVWRAACWLARTSRAAANRLRDWHHAGTTWSGQVLQSHWLAASNAARRRYIANQLRRIRRERHQHE